MPPRFNRDVEALLQRKFQFTPCDNRSDDHRWYELKLPGLPAIRTFFSHSKGEIPLGIWKRIALELKVRQGYLDGMIDCSNTREAYYKQVTDDPYPPWPPYLLERIKK